MNVGSVHSIVALGHGRLASNSISATFLTSLCLGILIWKMSKMIVSTSSVRYEKYMNKYLQNG